MFPISSTAKYLPLAVLMLFSEPRSLTQANLAAREIRISSPAAYSRDVGDVLDKNGSRAGRYYCSPTNTWTRAAGDNDSHLLKVIDVKSHGAVGDGSTNDSAAVMTAVRALPSSGGVVYFSPGTYLLNSAVAINAKSGVTFRGAGQTATTIRTTTDRLATFQPLDGAQATDVAWEDMTLRHDAANPGHLIALDGVSVRGVRIRRCTFLKGSPLYINGVTDVAVDDSTFHNVGSPGQTAVRMVGASKDLKFRNNRFLFFTDNLRVEPATGITEKLLVIGNYFDGGWYIMPQNFTGSGGTVTYTATAMTDRGANFSGISTDHNPMRVLTLQDSGMGTYTGRTKLTDASANFKTWVIKRGDIVRAGTATGIVTDVVNQHNLYVENWLTTADLTEAPIPSGRYSIYSVYLGRITSFTSTTITVERWLDLDGNTVSPADGTLYEVVKVRPNYGGLHTNNNVREATISHNTFRRSYGDQISYNGSRGLIADNIVEDGEDMGITLDTGSFNNTVTGNYIRKQGAGNIVVVGNDNVIKGNTCIDAFTVQSTGAVMGN
ncbi:MAG: right-handed parallel beta-helix repeat-containing protein, partial [Pyrinomonadaceae bacterium]|nr:right-handed parallel beta-helix repeat-containing protein [Pyrinomonadaceae bacterium]